MNRQGADGQALDKAPGRKPRDAARTSGRAVCYGDLTDAGAPRGIDCWAGIIRDRRSGGWKPEMDTCERCLLGDTEHMIPIT